MTLTKLTGSEREKAIAFTIREIEENMSSRDYQREFFESVSNQFERTHSISDKQLMALQKIYNRVTDARVTWR